MSLCPTPEDPPIEIISRIPTDLLPDSQRPAGSQDDPVENPNTIVAFRQGNHLFTSFHPELTKDDRFHEYFVQQCVMPSLSNL
jgi:5'-phosphate synthase pdxT subunit